MRRPSRPGACCGVYLLADRGRLVYVGTSRDCERRVRSHRGRLEFDSFWYGPIDPEWQRFLIERALIATLRPTVNILHKGEPAQASIDVYLGVRSLRHLRVAAARAGYSAENYARQLILRSLVA